MIEQHPDLKKNNAPVATPSSTPSAPVEPSVIPEQPPVSNDNVASGAEQFKTGDSATLTPPQVPSTPVDETPVNAVPEASAPTPETTPETVTPSPSTEIAGGTAPME